MPHASLTMRRGTLSVPLLALATLPARVASKHDCYIEDVQDKKGRFDWKNVPSCVELFLERASATGIGDDGVLGIVAELKKIGDKNVKLETMDLTGNRITAKGARALASWVNVSTKLRGVELRDNRLGDDGAIELGRAIGNSLTLESLGLIQTDMGDEGAVGLAAGVEMSVSLAKLALSFNYIGLVGGRALADAIAGNQLLKLTSFSIERNVGAEPVDDEDVKRIKGSLHKHVAKPSKPQPLSAARAAEVHAYRSLDEL